ncbi:pectinesterase family protein [Mucilaginibacter polytrichastri]|uniref:Pectinesterase n=1 Tax=Mucilaginibacter polytrichastri TaxID=1302689 RepID=A0A1Q5ZYX4_9SPHI|nr:pectinesterase family protein [Mucilaginibacter polytrichastri]OKS86963.1 putative pectinesterase/pectinesterase inhibitor 6 [Mucilaginibacter polytrichastri]SFS85050.1 pectinesterase [Mucilaginibacter polytrichastri]
MRLFLFISLGLLLSVTAYSQKRLIVAADGSGNYKTIQQAINAVADSSKQVTVIYIKKGIYKEKLILPATKLNVKMIGEDKSNTIITYDDYHARKDSTGKEIGTSGSASFYIYGAGFSAENLTIQNTAGLNAGQAVALWVAGDLAFFKNCRFLGFQDTLYTFGPGSRQLYVACYIEGTVDFIFGAATAWFQNCTIYCKKGGGFVTAASTPDSVKYGYVFKNCNITGDAPSQSFYLGRPWRPYAKVVYINCDLGTQIIAQGWDFWRKESNKTTAYYAEYKNTGDGFKPDDRVNWSHQLTEAEASLYTINNVLKGWNPNATIK